MPRLYCSAGLAGGKDRAPLAYGLNGAHALIWIGDQKWFVKEPLANGFNGAHAPGFETIGRALRRGPETCAERNGLGKQTGLTVPTPVELRPPVRPAARSGDLRRTRWTPLPNGF
jgi:hypothetical protein